jgi:hypothetical protein
VFAIAEISGSDPASGVGSPWEVKNVEIQLAQKMVEIELGWQ